MSDNEQLDYNLNYTKRMEQLFHEQIRKTIDVEVRLSMAFQRINEIQSQYQESQKQVEVQNDLMQQAGRSIEDLTIKGKSYELDIENLKKDHEVAVQKLNESITDLNRLVAEAVTERNEVALKYNENSEKLKELNRELERLQKECQSLFEENKVLKTEIEKLTPKQVPEVKSKTINKKTKELDNSSDIF